jgi:hypothetical protein
VLTTRGLSDRARVETAPDGAAVAQIRDRGVGSIRHQPIAGLQRWINELVVDPTLNRYQCRRWSQTDVLRLKLSMRQFWRMMAHPKRPSASFQVTKIALSRWIGDGLFSGRLYIDA